MEQDQLGKEFGRAFGAFWKGAKGGSEMGVMNMRILTRV